MAEKLNKINGMPLLLNIEQVAYLLGAGVGTVRKWAAGHARLPDGFPPFVRLGGRVMLQRAALENWVAGLAVARPAAPTAGAIGAPPRRGRGRPRKVAQTPGGGGAAC